LAYRPSSIGIALLHWATAYHIAIQVQSLHDSDNPGLSNHKRKRNLTVNHSRSRKSAVKATDWISNTTEPGIQITLGNPSTQNPNKTGIYVDCVVNLNSAPEVWEVLDECVAYVLDVSDTPGCLEFSLFIK
jgi:hypothetical protein